MSEQRFDSLFWSFFVPFFCVFVLGLIFVFRWDLSDWFEHWWDDVTLGRNRLVNFLSRWTTRHSRLLQLLDKVVLGPFAILEFALNLLLHRWGSVVLWGILSARFWLQLSRKRRTDKENHYLRQIEADMEQDAGKRTKERNFGERL